MKWGRHLWSLTPHVSGCLLSVENFSQRIGLIREMRKMQKQRKTVKGDQIIIIVVLSIVKDL